MSEKQNHKAFQILASHLGFRPLVDGTGTSVIYITLVILLIQYRFWPLLVVLLFLVLDISNDHAGGQ